MPDNAPRNGSHGVGRSFLDLCFVLLGKAATLGVVFIGGILAARFGGASAYAGFVAGMSFALLMDGILGTAFDLEVVRLGTSEKVSVDSAKVQATAFHLKWATLLLVSCLSLGFAFGFDLDLGSLPLLPSLLAASGILMARSIAVSVQLRGKFGEYSRIDAGQSLLRLGCFLLIAALGFVSPSSFLGVYAVVGALVVVWGIRKGYLAGVGSRFPSRGESVDFVKGMGATFFILACGATTGRGDVFALSLILDESRFAEYGVASQLTQLLSQLALYASVITQPRLMGAMRTGSLGKLAGLNLVVFLAAVGAYFVVMQLGLLELGVRLVFGADYLGSVQYLEILVLGGLLDLLIVPVFMTLGVMVAKKASAWGESIVAILFAVAVAYAIGRTEGEALLVAVAWIFVGTRLAKLLLYVGLYLRLGDRYSQ